MEGDHMQIKIYLILLMVFGGFFGAYAHVKLNSPLGGEYFAPSTSLTIKWEESIDHGGNDWDLYYTLDGGANWNEIAIDLDDAVHEYVWNVPFAETTRARIKVVQDNTADSDYDDESGNFTISSTQPDPDPDPDPEVITGLENDGMPIVNKLSNYPNPFQRQTIIRFTISQNSRVMISVYNLQGELVSSVFKVDLAKGNHEYVWKNHGLPAGVYICELQSQEWKLSNKMVLR